MACTPDELRQLPVSVVVCTAWLPRFCVHGVCGDEHGYVLAPENAIYDRFGNTADHVTFPPALT